MGWLKRNPKCRPGSDPQSQQRKDICKEDIIEHIENSPDTAILQRGAREQKYPFQAESVSNAELPMIPQDEVASKRRPGLVVTGDSVLDDLDIWIVVDDIVYDCTDFVHDHPGGQQVIVSFLGEDCSWQFWRFHNMDIMRQYGSELRIGRTTGALRRFQEPPKYIGLKQLGE